MKNFINFSMPCLQGFKNLPTDDQQKALEIVDNDELFGGDNYDDYSDIERCTIAAMHMAQHKNAQFAEKRAALIKWISENVNDFVGLFYMCGDTASATFDTENFLKEINKII